MSTIDWIKIIAQIIELIAEGMSKNQAVAKISAAFGVSESAIWKHGGF